MVEKAPRSKSSEVILPDGQKITVGLRTKVPVNALCMRTPPPVKTDVFTAPVANFPRPLDPGQGGQRGEDQRPIPNTWSLFRRDADMVAKPPLTDEEINRQIAIYQKYLYPNATAEQQAEKRAAHDEVFNSVIKLVIQLVGETYHIYGSREESVSDVYMVFLGCLNKYDPEHVSKKTGTTAKFSTYFARSVELLLRRRLRPPAYPIEIAELPKHATNYIPAVEDAYARLVQAKGREPSPDEWYAAIKQKKTKLRFGTFESILRLMNGPHILPLGEKLFTGVVDPDTLGPIMESVINARRITGDRSDQEKESPKNYAERKVLIAELRKAALDVLDERERKVLALVFIGDQMSLYEVGKKLGCSHETVRQIEERALGKLRAWGRRVGLKEFLT